MEAPAVFCCLFKQISRAMEEDLEALDHEEEELLVEEVLGTEAV